MGMRIGGRIANKAKGSPQIYSYLKKYQENPESRVFAPLAEAYRKAGLIDEAIEVAREGMRVHPTFVGGKVALGRALFDKQAYKDVVQLLEEVVRDVPDNLVAQRLMAESQLMVGDVPGALNAFKMLLYFNPHDLETAKVVWELESQLYENGEVLLKPSQNRAAKSDFEVQPAADALAQAPETQRNAWMKRVQFLQNLLQRVERYRRAAS